MNDTDALYHRGIYNNKGGNGATLFAKHQHSMHMPPGHISHKNFRYEMQAMFA